MSPRWAGQGGGGRNKLKAGAPGGGSAGTGRGSPGIRTSRLRLFLLLLSGRFCGGVCQKYTELRFVQRGDAVNSKTGFPALFCTFGKSPFVELV